MNPAPGLTDQSVNMTRPRRRRMNFVPQPGDRLPTTTTNTHTHTPTPTNSQREGRTTTSARAGRSTAPMVFDPEVYTPNWEVYRDPSTESLEAAVAQPDSTEPTTSNRTLATVSGSSQTAPSGQRVTEEPDSETSSFSPEPSTRPQQQPGQGRDEVSRIMTDRVQRTVDAVFSEERRRRRRFLRQQRRQAQHGNGSDAQVEYIEPTNAEMVARFQAKYAELTLLDQGNRYQRSGGELEVEQEPEQQPELEQNLNLEQMEESSQEHAQGQGHSHDLGQEGVAYQEQVQDLGIGPGEMTGGEEVQMTQQDYHNMPVETQQSIQQLGQRTFGPLTGALTSAELILDPLFAPASAYISQPMPPPRTGLSFAERARARGMEFDMSTDTDMEADVDLYLQVRKRARRIAPNPRDDDRLDMYMPDLALGTVGQAEMHPEDPDRRVTSLSERMLAARDAATATAAGLGNILAAASALAADLNAGVPMPVPTDPDSDQDIEAEPTAEASPTATDREVRKSNQKGRKQEREIKKLVHREARGLQRL